MLFLTNRLCKLVHSELLDSHWNLTLLCRFSFRAANGSYCARGGDIVKIILGTGRLNIKGQAARRPGIGLSIKLDSPFSEVLLSDRKMRR